jgi:crossover junction endodeoxyribonuclease RusA
VIIKLPYPPSELNPNKRLHWAEKRKHTMNYRELCKYRFRMHFINELGAIEGMRALKGFENHVGDFKVSITFHKPDNRKRDDDNIIASFKAGRDGVADALNVDDNRFEVSYKVSKENVKGGLVVIEVSK